MRISLLALGASLIALAPWSTRGEEGSPPPTAPDLTPRPRHRLDLLLEEPPPVARDPALEAAVQRRRTLLDVHQAAGLATWGLMAATVAVGQLNYQDLYGSGRGTGKYREPHVALAGASTASFAFTGILALAAPKPYPKPIRFDTATVHKASMGLATLGLVGQVALGYLTRNPPASADPRSLARAHQGLGYATFGAMTIGAVTLLF